MIDKSVKIAQLMTKNVLTLHSHNLMKDAAEIFETNSFHHIPIIDEQNLIEGMLSRVEYHKLLHAFTFFKDEFATKFNKEIFESVLVEDMMNKPVATLYPDDTIEQALGYFRENIFHAAPVINKKTRQIEGIITTFDLMNYAFQDKKLLL